MTEKLYYTSAYTKDWDATVVNAYEKDGKYFVILDRTYFYPEGGGQPSDTGWINENKVVDVTTEGEDVIHEVEQEITAKTVTCKIDWNRRFDHMQHHSGQHLVSAMSLKLFNASTLSFHLGKEVVTVDIDLQKMTDAQLVELEEAVNQEIINNRHINSYFVTAKELQNIPVVKQPKVTENIRIVETEGIEFNPCGGTHVRQTGEIGLLKLLKVEKQKGVSRIHFKCGKRALKDYNDSLVIVHALSDSFQTGRHEVLSRFEAKEKEQQDIKEKLAALQEKLDCYEVKELINEADGTIISYVYGDKTAKELQSIAHKLTDSTSKIIILASTLENKLLISHTGNTDFHSGQVVKNQVSEFNGRGGGNQQTAQAGFPTNEDLLACFNHLKETVNKMEVVLESK